MLTRLKDAKPQFLMDAVSAKSSVIDALTNPIITPSLNHLTAKVKVVAGKANAPVKSNRKGFYITLILSAAVILTVTYVINKKRENN
jgi:hypothetical protein